MRWDRNHRSGDVIDRRGEGGTAGAGVGGAGILFWLFSRFGIKGLLIGGVVLAVGYFMSARPSADPSSADGRSTPAEDRSQQRGVTPAGEPAAQDDPATFVGFVLDDVQKTWQEVFAEQDLEYSRAKLVLFSGATASGCGTGTTQTGPFYCPRDRRVYIDLDFYRELDRRFGAPGDFAQAYVIAHEVGHHVQNLLGTQERARALARGTAGENEASIRQELQADCFAGIWAHSTHQRDILQAGDVEEGLRAAAAVGDDALQRQAQGRVSPESWTHGSSDQRVRWFKRGYDTGSTDACDTAREGDSLPPARRASERRDPSRLNR
ncbi:MAG TPA: neutral zinc metallopeptidase [Polyangiaceae bacterium]|nr:neutral zinc metallopeptidase [Polyangiaceae bacterium]